MCEDGETVTMVRMQPVLHDNDQLVEGKRSENQRQVSLLRTRKCSKDYKTTSAAPKLDTSEQGSARAPDGLDLTSAVWKNENSVESAIY